MAEPRAATQQGLRGAMVKGGGKPKPIAAAPGRRTCAGEDCATVLSKYNHGRFCHSCDNPRDDTIMGRQNRG